MTKSLALLFVVSACLFAQTFATADDNQPGIKYYIFREDCYNRFLAFDISDVECIKFSASKGIGYAIILGSVILKVPQIQKIVASGSADGINVFSVYVEFFNFLGLIGNSVRMNLAFSVYGEAVFINVQNLIIMMLCWNYSKTISTVEILAVSAVMSAYYWLLFKSELMDDQLWQLVASSQTAMVLLSRVPQIFQNWHAKSTGQLAFITFFLSWAGTIARAGTVFFESDDFLYRLQFVVSLVMNSVIMVQFALYWSNVPKPKKRARVVGPGAKSPEPKKDK